MSKNPIIKNDYISIPRKYIEDLQNRNMRDKARAFMEYYFDMENGKANSFEFYADSWSVSSCTAEYWIKEFSSEIDKFFSKFLIDNQQHYDFSLKDSIDLKIECENN